MATELNGEDEGEVTCPEHGEQAILEYGRNDDLRYLKLACGCQLSFNVVRVADAVLCEGELFRVVEVIEGEAYDDVLLRNNETSFYTQSCAVQYIARDTLSATTFGSPMASFDIMYGKSGPSRYFPGNGMSSTPPKEKKKPATRKTHAISTADLIKSEVKNLETRKPSGELAEAVAEPSKDTNETPLETGPIPRRDGDW